MRIERYTELYLDDAMRLCKYIAKEDGAISIGLADPSLFPDPPKNIPWPDALYAVTVRRDGETVAECAYLFMREDASEAGKFKNRWLISVMLGEEIRRARERRGLSQDQLAELTGYRPHSIDAMERGRYTMDIKLVGRLADALGCEIKLVDINE